METAGVEPASSPLQAGALPPELHPRRVRCGRMESNHHSARRRVYSAGSSPDAQRPQREGRPTGSNRYREDHDLGCCRYTTVTMNEAGTTGLEPATSRLTSERSAQLSYAPGLHISLSLAMVGSRPTARQAHSAGSAGRGEPKVPNFRIRAKRGDKDHGGEAAIRFSIAASPEWRGWDSNPRSRAHEAREDSLSSTARRRAIWPAGIEPAVSDARSRRGGLLPHSQKKSSTYSTPGGS